ncbi:transglutaminase-like cysteine peptidase [Daeguia caeni]|uniref:Transglutaminase-like cysteine peptidase n=1 Tax=Daeguia caeni TaxID=439612 RepID=A0ABV9HBJ6_9HYPH
MFCVGHSIRKVKAAMAVAATMLFAGFTCDANASAFMQTGKITSQPIGHYEFCKREAEACSVVSTDTRPLKLTPENWQLIIEINQFVNDSINPLTDMEIYGVEEFWAYPTTAGDCEDYVLLKQRELGNAGIPISNLLITVVRKPDGEGHAVLTVRTDRGDFVLDNLTDTVSRWDETDYTYLKRQAVNHSGRWVSIETPDNLLVGSVK